MDSTDNTKVAAKNGQRNALELFAIAACIILFVFQAYWTYGNNFRSQLPKLSADITEASVSASPTEQRSLAYNLLRRRDSLHNLTDWVTLTDPGRWVDKKEHPEPSEFKQLEGIVDQRTEADITLSLIKATNWHDTVITEANNRMDLLQQFILPLLYGWIGALVYILRSDRKENTGKDPMLLGMLAGLAIGWFFKPSNTEVNGVGLVSPFALAFLAGYSADQFFSAIDRVVSSLHARVVSSFQDRVEKATAVGEEESSAKSAPAIAPAN